jgi:hypothetical protein
MTDQQWESTTKAINFIRAAVDRRKMEDRSAERLMYALFAVGGLSLTAGVVAGFLGNTVLTGLLLGTGAAANALLTFPIRELRRKRDLNLVLETVPALFALGGQSREVQRRLATLTDRLIALVERGY